MIEYLIGPAGPVNALSRFSSEGLEAPEDAVPGGDGATDDQYRIVTADCAKNIGPSLTVEGSCDGLSAPWDRAQNQHLPNAIDAEEKLRQQGVECCSAFLYAAVGNRVSGAFRSRDPGKPQFAEVAGEGRLRHVPPALEQHLPKIFLAAHDSSAYDLQDCVVSFALVGHGVSLAPRKALRERAARIIDAKGV
jgi:hypothetical protein